MNYSYEEIFKKLICEIPINPNDNVNSFLSALDGKYVASEEELIQAINGEKIDGFN